MTIWRTRIACWIPKATNAVRISINFLLSHCNNSGMNAPYRYVIRTLPLLLFIIEEDNLIVC
jgi:hypothetical protein